MEVFNSLYYCGWDLPNLSSTQQWWFRGLNVVSIMLIWVYWAKWGLSFGARFLSMWQGSMEIFNNLYYCRWDLSNLGYIQQWWSWGLNVIPIRLTWGHRGEWELSFGARFISIWQGSMEILHSWYYCRWDLLNLDYTEQYCLNVIPMMFAWVYRNGWGLSFSARFMSIW